MEKKIKVWLMRQAGRYLPEYQEIRKKEKDFMSLCFNPNLACDISLQPIQRFDFDFIILFSDILVIPYALGQEVKFEENLGPILGNINYSTHSSRVMLQHMAVKKPSTRIVCNKNKLSPFTRLH